MATIYLPTMAAFRGDVETTFGVLEKALKGTKHKPGLEVIGKADHFQSQETMAKIVQNIKEVSGNNSVVIHGFSGPAVYESGFGDMRTQSGSELLASYAKLADELNAKYVHVHSGAGHKGKNYSRQQLSKDISDVRKILLPFSSKKFILGIENLPSPSMGDVKTNPDEVDRDCTETLEDCLELVNGTRMGITFDTCHYACGRKGKIDLVEALKLLGNKLAYVHIGDVEGYWEPNKSVWKEGRIPGNGRIGNEQFKKFFAYLQQKHPDVGIEAEVYNADFKNPEESKESVKRIVKWLD